jgi:hypothetical protein
MLQHTRDSNGKYLVPLPFPEKFEIGKRGLKWGF